ncbi:MAG: hypothetical protein NC548_40810 [Lachnospiraceae bacterium]|nr:hypothetical protein [Lachnospiraceae bacterium]
MKIGSIIQNDDMVLTVVAYHETEKGNIALLVREEETCHYLTVRDLSHEKNGNYHWYYGHYANNFEAAARDYFERKTALL